jgi:hypothetical protein
LRVVLQLVDQREGRVGGVGRRRVDGRQVVERDGHDARAASAGHEAAGVAAEPVLVRALVTLLLVAPVALLARVLVVVDHDAVLIAAHACELTRQSVPRPPTTQENQSDDLMKTHTSLIREDMRRRAAHGHER